MSLLNCFLGSQSRKLHGISCSFEGYPLRNFFFWEPKRLANPLELSALFLFHMHRERSQFINFFSKPCEISFLWLTLQGSLKSSIASLC